MKLSELLKIKNYPSRSRITLRICYAFHELRTTAKASSFSVKSTPHGPFLFMKLGRRPKKAWPPFFH